MAGVSVGGKSETLSLNIMPMLDVFSILIVFLLMSYSTDPISVDPPAGLVVPRSSTIRSLDEQPVVIVTEQEVFVNDKKVATIGPDGDVTKEDLEKGQGAIYAVFEELEKLAEQNKAIRRRLDGEEKPNIDALTLEMDKGHNFKLMKRIMLSAQQAEFITFKLMVEKEKR